jgi:bacteriorhodopsin
LGIVNLAMEAMLYMVLDVAAKFGFGLVLLSAVRRLVPKQAEEELEDIIAVPA